MSKPTIKDLQAEMYSLKARHAMSQGANERLLKEVKRLKGSPKVQEQLNMANATVADLMKEVETLKELAHTRLHELTCKAESLKSLHAQHDTLKSDYALLEEKYYTQSDNYTEVNKDYKNLLDRFTEISAENHALKAEIERTNRHINLAENQLHKEQQPLVVNHYHNCTINK